MNLPQQTLEIVGLDYPNRNGSNRRKLLSECVPGDPVSLQREPLNKADSRAIAVIGRGGAQFGYVSAERAARLAPMLDRGRTVMAIFQGTADRRAYLRIAYDGEIPTLP